MCLLERKAKELLRALNEFALEANLGTWIEKAEAVLAANDRGALEEFLSWYSENDSGDTIITGPCLDRTEPPTP